MIARPLAVALLLCVLAPARAQAPLTLVDDETTVATMGFDFVDGQTLLIENLELQIATKAPVKPILWIFRRGDEGPYPFLPIELAKDVVRLTRYYEDSGFPRAQVDYEVELDTTDNAVDVTFVIEEGPPRLIGEVTFAGPGQSSVQDALPPDIREAWGDFKRRTALREGARLDAFALVQLQSQTLSWLRNRGYAWADAGAEQFPDSTGLRADVRVKVNLGPQARIGAVTVEGDSSMSANVITRELPFATGDSFDASALAEGQREVFGLGLFQLALVDVAPEAVRGDTTVPVSVRVRRGPSRVLSAFTGYFSDGGITLRTAATHRNAFGGARQLGVNVEWRTGIASGIGGTGATSVSGGPIRDFRAAVPFRQPYVFDRRLSYTLQPSYRVRDDEIESSVQAEVANTLLLTLAPLRTAALSLTGRSRDLSRGLGIRILDAGRIDSPLTPFLPDTLRATTGVLGLDVAWGTLDDPLQPTRGYVVRPSLSVAAGDIAYGRARVAASVTRPIGARTTLVSRVTLGTLLSTGGADPDSVGDYVLFRDQLFYAGGTSDVRGWSSAQLGPKTFSVTPPALTAGVIPDPTLLTSSRDVNYVGVGGRYKASASVQLTLPLDALGPQWGAQVFADAGGVWSPSTVPAGALLRAGGTPADSSLADQLDKEGGLRVGVGAGLSYLTPVGFVAVGLGVKVNPSYLDLRQPARVYCGASIYADEPSCVSPLGQDETPGYVDARAAGVAFDPTVIPVRSVVGVGFLDAFLRRTQLYITIGQTF
ncbi:hypothetical protein B1759_07590 [Rubrivirga sp. SAORIC476]|uniref:BamA/OMP85 family outer membrane protein n=1 Tax=Rubrivirga sp. SAORIC476 TaxID=1961794 RepID=UPI000BA9209C|nr:BamA/TamA family outer membrane protein [Rubrivirga sp. SAORIC476]PAP81193.1 hypothetical protein B1759_07590 [Rubrivirga sp. SAORIC476]